MANPWLKFGLGQGSTFAPSTASRSEAISGPVQFGDFSAFGAKKPIPSWAFGLGAFLLFVWIIRST